MGTHLSVRLSDDLATRLEEFADSQERSKGWVVSKALEGFLPGSSTSPFPPSETASTVPNSEVKWSAANKAPTGSKAELKYVEHLDGNPRNNDPKNLAIRRRCSCGGFEKPNGHCSKCAQKDRWA